MHYERVADVTPGWCPGAPYVAQQAPREGVETSMPGGPSVIIPWTLARSRLARAVQDGASPERVAELRRAYHASRAADYLQRLLACDPPPTPDQRRELADILVGGDADVAA